LPHSYASSNLDNIDRSSSSELKEYKAFSICKDALPADAFCIASDSVQEDWELLSAIETKIKST
jgi:hypothetical protein